MKKLVLGLVSVFCLQVGFVAYNASEAYLETSATAIGAADPINEIAENATLPDTEWLIPYPFEASTEMKTSIAVKLRKTRHSAIAGSGPGPIHTKYKFSEGTAQARSRARQTNFASLRKPSGDKFKKDYGSLISSTPITSELDKSQSETRRHEKKSFARKALPILKKPFDWMKSIGSIFN